MRESGEIERGYNMKHFDYSRKKSVISNVEYLQER